MGGIGIGKVFIYGLTQCRFVEKHRRSREKFGPDVSFRCALVFGWTWTSMHSTSTFLCAKTTVRVCNDWKKIEKQISMLENWEYRWHTIDFFYMEKWVCAREFNACCYTKLRCMCVCVLCFFIFDHQKYKFVCDHI